MTSETTTVPIAPEYRSFRLSSTVPLAVFYLALVSLLLYGAATTQGFVSVANLKAILASVGIIGIAAVGMSCITLSGSFFSLTIGTTIVVSSMAFLGALQWGIVAAIVVTLAIGLVVATVQGYLVGAFGANPIVVTIAFGAMQLGVAAKLTHESTVYPPAGASYKWLADTIFGIPVSVYVLLVVTILLELWLRRSRLGQELYLTGENRRAARAGALRVTTVTTVAFGAAGMCAALAGILLGATNRNATFLTSETFTFDAIAAVLVGGMAITGGRGAVYRTVLGALFIAIVSDMLLLRGYSTGVQVLVRGIVVLLVIVGVQLWRRDRG